jgi:hypothetical protein
VDSNTEEYRCSKASKEQLATRKDVSGMVTKAPKSSFGFLVMALKRGSGEVLRESVVAERLPITGVHGTNGYASFSRRAWRVRTGTRHSS